MITTDEIAIRVCQLLQASDVKSMITGKICQYRIDYTKEDVIIIPHTIDGEDSVRSGQIKVNIHVPDIPEKLPNGKAVFIPNKPRLGEIRAKVIEVLRCHYERGHGYNWTVGPINSQPIKEQGHDEHFVSIDLEITVRERKY